MTLAECTAALRAVGWRDCEASPCALAFAWLRGRRLEASAETAAFTCAEGKRWHWRKGRGFCPAPEEGR